MIEIMSYNSNYFSTVEDNNGKIILYGAGTIGKIATSYISNITCFCDKGATKIKKLAGINVLLPKDLTSLDGVLNILICVNNKQSTLVDIYAELNTLEIEAKVFNIFNNCCFKIEAIDYRYKVNYLKESFKIHLVNYDDMGWICTKFANRLEENLLKMNIHVDISEERSMIADINHHIPFQNFNPIVPVNDTAMITHVDTCEKLNLIYRQSINSKMLICMSKETMNTLSFNGVKREKLCYINPAHDAAIKPKKFILGLTHRNHDALDYRKNIWVLIEVIRDLDPQYFHIKIMGSGWGGIVAEIIRLGFTVEYFDEFDYEEYTKLMPTLDYYLFFGYDEGSMGYLDALSAGVNTIVTPQGYHLDAHNGISYSCETIKHFRTTLKQIQDQRSLLVKSVEDWTWENYTKKHLEIWYYLTRRKELGELLKNKHHYNDGIFSVLLDNFSK